ncbi:DeoR/GlpR family DNA-binding transcription regulator [Bacillus sp. OVS6]|nr:DeoR/GlpR family DNA-binding transcription regulator [Bacillus sp. OVS6]
MYQEERLISILDYLKENKRITADQICSLYDVSKDTARRDLVKLEEQKLIIRTRGGAILPSSHTEIKDYQNRLQTVSYEKELIGKKAASLIREGDRIILDASTTVQACAEFIDVKNAAIITNSINQADILSTKPGIHIHLLGENFKRSIVFYMDHQWWKNYQNIRLIKCLLGLLAFLREGCPSLMKKMEWLSGK